MIAPFSYNADGAVSRVLPGGNDTSVDTSRATISRVAVRDASQTKNTSDTNVRSTVSRVVAGTPAGEIKSQSRGGVMSRALTQAGDSGRGGLSSAVNTVGRNERVSSASINANPSVRRAGLVLRPSTAEVGGRATIGDTGVQTGSNIDEELRGVKSRAASTTVPTAESIAQAKERLENTASLNKSCQEQYNECMDQFCAIVDQNQKRCSCSANISNYAKVESAVKDANAQLNEVAQRIRYVGLSADEIRAILTETEAEIALNGTTDTSETRSMLEDIEDLIRNPTSNTSYSSSTGTDFGLDLDLDFSSESADMFSLDFLNTDSSSSVSNLRGAELYNAAKKRCNTVLNQCKQAGGTANQITGNYDLMIDKDCIAYEQGLSKMNDSLLSNVRSANLMLQKARLAVLQNKNQYDAKGCVSALETCMTDDMVCGENYFKCVDPTKKYIDENGEVILGQDISKIKDFMKAYDNGNINTEKLKQVYGSTISDGYCTGEGNDGSCVVKYLLNKIGTKSRVTDEGLCRAVLEKCQYYTYDKNNNYMPYNDIVVNYIQRAMVNIRAAQYNIISEYASSCMVDVANCYNQQVTQVNSWSSSTSVNSIYNVMRGACRDVALTCAYAVFNGDDSSCSPNAQDTCINNISEMFFNSMLCGEGEVYVNGTCINASLHDTLSLRLNKTAKGIVGLKDDGYGNWNIDVYYYLDDKGNKVYYDLALPGIDRIQGIDARFTRKYDPASATGPVSGFDNLSWCWVPGNNQVEICTRFANGYASSPANYFFVTPVIKSADIKKIIDSTNKYIYLSVYGASTDCMSSYAKKWTSTACTYINEPTMALPEDQYICEQRKLGTCIRHASTTNATYQKIVSFGGNSVTLQNHKDISGSTERPYRYTCVSKSSMSSTYYDYLIKGNNTTMGYCAAIAYPGECTNAALYQYNCTVGTHKFCVDAGSYRVNDRVEDGLLEAVLKEFFNASNVNCDATKN